MKRLLRTAPVQDAIAWLAAQYIRFVFATSRWHTIGAEAATRLQTDGKPLILCFWHGRMLMMPMIWVLPRPFYMLISDHRDGRLISRTVGHLGIQTIVGSSSRGGAAALRGMMQKLVQGYCVGITPDGPRGPRMRASAGVAVLAKLAGVPVVPVAFSCSPARVASSWDRFVVALPFGRGVFIWGEPVSVAADADEFAMESARVEIESRLNQITREADRLCGRPPVEPAPASAGLATDSA